MGNHSMKIEMYLNTVFYGWKYIQISILIEFLPMPDYEWDRSHKFIQF